MSYAADTTVPVARTRDEIERVLTKYGATQFMFAWDDGRAIVAFRMHGRQVRFVVPFPELEDFALTPRRIRRSASAQKDAYDKALRSRWRAMLLVIKAKLEAVESGIVSFETEFLAQMVLPDNRTVGDLVVPAVERAYRENTMPELLPDYRPAIEA